MSANSQTIQQQQKGLGGLITNWPPVVYFGVGIICSGVWLMGTAVQVQTSEAWIMGIELTKFPTLGTFGQIYDFFAGNLQTNMVVPFTFAWGTQIALIIGSFGVELPREPRWRWWLAVLSTGALIAINSAGDYHSSEAYGGWGQAGFTVVVFFMTFVVGLIAIMCFTHAFKKMK